MRTPKVTLPEEDPATKAAREREERRAENARTEETQAWLLGATGRRNRRFGSLGGGGSVPIAGGPTSPGAGVSGAGGMGSVFSGATGSGGSSRGSGFDRSLATLY